MKKIAIIGGGFYGCNLAIDLMKENDELEITIFEKQDKILQGAISNNQHRLHLGFHYPRCTFTTEQSIKTNPVFIQNYGDCLYDPKQNVYLIHKDSKISYEKYLNYYSKYNLDFRPVEVENFTKYLRDPSEIEGAIICDEKVINLQKLITKILELLKKYRIKIVTNYSVEKIENGYIFAKKNKIKFDYIINCAYFDVSLDSEISIKTKSELCFIPILNDEENYFDDRCFTVMDGEFGSLYQTGIKNIISVSNVKLTPFYKSNDYQELVSIKQTLAKRDVELISTEIIKDTANIFDKIDNLSIIKCYITIKTKLLDDKNDYRGSYYLSSNKCTTILCGKISAYYDLKDSLITTILEQLR